MSVRPIDYARPDLPAADDPIRSGPTTTGFYIEIAPTPVKTMVHVIIALIIGVLIVIIAVITAAGLVGIVLLGALMIWLVERELAQRNRYAAFELDGDRFVAHHGVQRHEFRWSEIKRFEHMRFDHGQAAVFAMLKDGRELELYRTKRDLDVERVVRMLNDEKHER
jgi:hypothetical protein